MSLRRVNTWFDEGRYIPEEKRRQMRRNGEPVPCRECGGPIHDRSRISFCSQECSDRFNVRSRPEHGRFLVWQRDNGYCRACGADLAEARKPDGTPKRMAPGTVWQCDHVVPVAEGGGECTLDNLRALCTACHRRETAVLRRRLAEARRKA